MTVIEEVKEEIYSLSDCDREKLFLNCINNKLRNILLNYNLDLSLNSDYLSRRAGYKVLKTFTKIQKVEDRKQLKEITKNKGEQQDG